MNIIKLINAPYNPIYTGQRARIYLNVRCICLLLDIGLTLDHNGVADIVRINTL